MQLTQAVNDHHVADSVYSITALLLDGLGLQMCGQFSASNGYECLQLNLN